MHTNDVSTDDMRKVIDAAEKESAHICEVCGQPGEIRLGGFISVALRLVPVVGGSRGVKLAIISDLHSDIVSLDAALARIQKLGCDLVVCAGDLVDGDVFPDEVIACLLADRIPTIRGNHDRWALDNARPTHASARRRRCNLRGDGSSLVFEDESIGTVSGFWENVDRPFGSGAELSPESMSFLAALPASLYMELQGVRVAVWHASPGSDMLGIEPERMAPSRLARLCAEAATDVLVVGHTHEALAAPAGEGLVVNPGARWSGASVGTFGVLELPARRFSVCRASDGGALEG